MSPCTTSAPDIQDHVSHDLPGSGHEAFQMPKRTIALQHPAGSLPGGPEYNVDSITRHCQAWQASYKQTQNNTLLHCTTQFSAVHTAPRHAPAGNPCEVYAPQAMEAISACLRRNRLGLCNAPLNTPVKTMGELVTPPTMYHTVQPFDPSSTPESKEGGSARRVLQTIDKENWALSTGKPLKQGIGVITTYMTFIEP